MIGDRVIIKRFHRGHPLAYRVGTTTEADTRTGWVVVALDPLPRERKAKTVTVPSDWLAPLTAENVTIIKEAGLWKQPKNWEE